MSASAPALPPFCRARTPSPSSQHNAEAVSEGRIGSWPVPAGSLLWFSAKGELMELIPSVPVTLEGVTFAADARVGFVWERPFRGTLYEDTVLAGTPCRGGVETQIHPVDGGWYPLAGTLAADATLDGFEALADTSFQRLDVGRLVLFTPSRDTVIDGVPCEGRAPVRRQEGRLWVATLATDRTIDGVPCAAGGPVHFRAGGLTHARLRRTWTTHGASWREGTLVSGALREGRVREGTLDVDAPLDGLPLAGGSLVRCDAKGRPEAFTLARDAEVDGFLCRAGSRVQRRGVRSYTLAGPRELRGAPLEAGDVVTIDEWGDDPGVPVIRLGGERELRGRRFPAGSTVYLYGWLCRRISVRLGAGASIDGVEHPAETLLEFDRRDRLVRVFPPRAEKPYR